MVAVLHVEFARRQQLDIGVDMFSECPKLADKLMILAGKMVEEVDFYGSVPAHILTENDKLMAFIHTTHTEELPGGITDVHDYITDLMIFLDEDLKEQERELSTKIVTNASTFLRVVK